MRTRNMAVWTSSQEVDYWPSLDQLCHLTVPLSRSIQRRVPKPRSFRPPDLDSRAATFFPSNDQRGAHRLFDPSNIVVFRVRNL